MSCVTSHPWLLRHITYSPLFQEVYSWNLQVSLRTLVITKHITSKHLGSFLEYFTNCFWNYVLVTIKNLTQNPRNSVTCDPFHFFPNIPADRHSDLPRLYYNLTCLHLGLREREVYSASSFWRRCRGLRRKTDHGFCIKTIICKYLFSFNLFFFLILYSFIGERIFEINISGLCPVISTLIFN